MFGDVGVVVQGAGEFEEDVAEAVEEDRDVGADRGLVGQAKNFAFGPAADGAGQVGAGGGGRAAGQDEVLERGQVRPVALQPLVKRGDVRRRDAVAAGAAAGVGQVRAESEEAGLHPGQAVRVVAGRAGAHRHAEGRVELVNGAEGSDAAVRLGHTRAVEEAGLALVAVVLAGHWLPRTDSRGECVTCHIVAASCGSGWGAEKHAGRGITADVTPFGVGTGQPTSQRRVGLDHQSFGVDFRDCLAPLGSEAYHREVVIQCVWNEEIEASVDEHERVRPKGPGEIRAPMVGTEDSGSPSLRHEVAGGGGHGHHGWAA